MDNLQYAALACVFDSSCLGKIQALRVFISGSGLLITELTRNLLLLGFQDLTLHIPPSQFSFITKNLPELQSISSSATIKTTENPLTDSDFNNFDLIICNSNSGLSISQYNSFCRLSSNKPAFINCEQWGGLSYIFIDFQDFHSEDVDGLALTKGYISCVTQSNPGQVYLSEPNNEFNDEDLVIFGEVQGMSELNTIGPVRIKKLKDYLFEICDTSLFKAYEKNGFMERIKKGQEFLYDSWDEAFKSPKSRFHESFHEDSGLSQQELHFFHRVLRKFCEKTGRFPEIGSSEQAEEVVKLAEMLNNEDKLAGFEYFEKFDTEKLKLMALYYRVEIPALASYWAGVVALNILKYFGKFKPIFQWIYEDHSETVKNLCEKTLKTCKTSSPALSNPAKPTIFIAGAGLLTYEILKIFKQSGRLADFNFIIADNEKVEENLTSSQYIFTKSNLGQYKSEVLEALLASTETEHHIKPLNISLNEENSKVFCENFWNHVDFAIDAINNLKDKDFLYRQILWYEKPAVFHRIQKLKIRVASCLPHLSQLPDSFFDYENLVDMKSIHSFPHSYKICVLWAKNIFYEYFFRLPSEIENLHNDKELHHKSVSNLQQIKDFLICVKEKQFSFCLQFAVSVFLDKFYFTPLKLLETFPLDHSDKYGVPLWNSKRKPPITIPVNFQDPVQKSFILNFAKILASLLNNQIENLDVVVDENKLEYKKTSDDEEKNNENRLREEINALCGYAGQVQGIGVDLELGKEFHAEFFYSCCFLRALEFSIEPLSKIDTILMGLDLNSGAYSVTALTAGLICSEIFKYFECRESQKPLDHCLNIAENLFLHTKSPQPTKTYDLDFDPILLGPVKAYPPGFTIWDKLTIPGPLSLESFISFMSTHHNLSTSHIVSQKFTIYSVFTKTPKYEDQKTKNLETIFQEKGGDLEGLNHLNLTLICEVPDSCIDCNIPPIKYIFN